MTIQSIETPDGASPAPLDAHDREARQWLETVYQGDHVKQLSVR